jgi:hypothetical protein
MAGLWTFLQTRDISMPEVAFLSLLLVLVVVNIAVLNIPII